MSQENHRNNEQESSPESASVKERYVELRGREFLVQSGYAELFEDTKTLPHFDEISRSSQTAIREFNVGTPKGLKADSATEREQIELFFMELRHGDIAAAFKKHTALVGNGDRAFQSAIARTIKSRSVANNRRLSLPFWVLVGWRHWFLWGLSNNDRVELLRRVLGIAIRSAVGNAPEVIRKTITRLKVKGWSDYRGAYPKPPLSLVLFRSEEHEECQIVFSSIGQS
jgi:hypothetical protein